MEDFDNTPLNENESECPYCAALGFRVAALEVMVADLEALLTLRVARGVALEVQVADLAASRAVMRQALEDQDEEWF